MPAGTVAEEGATVIDCSVAGVEPEPDPELAPVPFPNSRTERNCEREPPVVTTLVALINARPLAKPLAVGVYVTVKPALMPGAKTDGRAGGLILKTDPFVTAELMLHVLCPLLVIVMVRVRLLPTATEPKFTAEGLGLSGPWPKPRAEHAIKKETSRTNRPAVECEGWLLTVRPPLRVD